MPFLHFPTSKHAAFSRTIEAASVIAAIAALQPAAAQSPESAEELRTPELMVETPGGSAVGEGGDQGFSASVSEGLGAFAKTGSWSSRIKAGSADETLVYIDTLGTVRSGPDIAAQFSRFDKELPAELPADKTFRQIGTGDPSLATGDLEAIDKILDRQAKRSPVGRPVEAVLFTRESRILDVERFATVPRAAFVERMEELSWRVPERAERDIMASVGGQEMLFGSDLEAMTLRLVREQDLERDVADELLDLPYNWRIVGRPAGGMVPPVEEGLGRPPGVHEPRMVIADPVFPLPFPVVPDGARGIVENPGPITEVCGGDEADPVTHCALSTVMLMHGGYPICSGVLVSEAHVLTAAHCVCPGEVGETRGQPSEIRIAVGNAGGDLFLRVDEGDPVSIYEGPYMGFSPCSSWEMGEQLRWGDVAVLHVDPASYDEVRTELMSRGAEAQAEANKLKAKIGVMDDADWDRNVGETFAFYGFGTGPHGQDGVKRADMITLHQAVACESGPTCIGPPAVQEAIFQDDHIGLCASDSGGGVFKPVETPQAGFGRWAVVGILSGGPGTSACHSPDNVLFDVQEDRYFVRLDAPGISAWLDETLGAAADRVSVTDFYPVEVAGADQ